MMTNRAVLTHTDVAMDVKHVITQALRYVSFSQLYVEFHISFNSMINVPICYLFLGENAKWMGGQYSC